MVAYADAKGEACNGIGGCTADAGGGVSLNSIINAVVNILSLVVGVVAVIMIIVGGFTYVTSNGDRSAITSAKHTIIHALIGLVIVALAQTLVKFVLNKVTKAGG